MRGQKERKREGPKRGGDAGDQRKLSVEVETTRQPHKEEENRLLVQLSNTPRACEQITRKHRLAPRGDATRSSVTERVLPTH